MTADPDRAVPGLFWTKIVHPLMGPVRDPCGAVRILPPWTGAVEYGPRTDLGIINSTWTARAGPQGARAATYDVRAEFLQILVVPIPLRVRKVPYGTHVGPARPPHESRRIWKTIENPVRGLYRAVVGCDWGIIHSQCSVWLKHSQSLARGIRHSKMKQNTQVCFLCIF